MDQRNNNQQHNIQIATIEQLRIDGYYKNYSLDNEQSVRCLEDDNCYNYDRAIIKLINHNFDMATKHHSLLFIVETIDGNKGIMTLPLNGVSKRTSRKLKEDLIEAFWLSL